ncbi:MULTISPECIES: NAD(P)/FAD-dependent oxidoreductase [Kordiimonas]|uniref:NAD(P)/FAD-dependent oxidoreductase n=1 Tax=Kordiimonas TaxID=288021 RepID=UPI00257B29EA|nr:FAD-dependent oxidoreductase [Kordiimonas sp. UBA4487]
MHQSRITYPPCRGEAHQDIAVIGSGIAGLSCAWLLGESATVTVYEANDYIGGHSNTVDIEVGGKSIPVDTGFIVYNPTNYPNLTALFDRLDVPTKGTDMSFSVSLDDGQFEYSGGDGFGLLAQPTNLLRPRFWKMIIGILRFYKKSDAFLAEADGQDISLRTLLGRHGFTETFIKDHLAPMGAAIWSSNCDDILDYPAASFLRFFRNHGLVQLADRPAWRTVMGGSREYVKRLTAPFKNQIRLADPVEQVRKLGGKFELITRSGARSLHDHVVFACHSDQALRMIDQPHDATATALSAMRYSRNRVALHSDISLMPRRKAAWASWNYIERRDATRTAGPAVSYWMNRLQHLDTDHPVIVTLNPDRDIRRELVHGWYDYEHPVFDRASHAARQQLWAGQGIDNMWFCGAYLGDGFHEDGIQAGLAVAEMLGGVPRPWQKPGQNARIGLADQLLEKAPEAA